jgi:hypothetical protein
MFEVLTAEFVDSLAEYLGIRHGKLATSAAQAAPLLEVGAGSGRLAHFLNAHPSVPVEVVAVDDGSWKLGTSTQFPVVEMQHAWAVAQYTPAIVVCAWMPENTDFTVYWREAPSVEEYVLIGPANSGLSGLPWETWGYANPMLPEGLPAEEVAQLSDMKGSTDPKIRTLLSMQTAFESARDGVPPPYANDGFTKIRVDAVCDQQISRRDCSGSVVGFSETVSFRRNT